MSRNRWAGIAIASLAANAALGALLWLAPGRSSARSSDAVMCEHARADIDFFIQGLDREQDAYYSPLAVRSLEHLLKACRPNRSDEIGAILLELRTNLNMLIKPTTAGAERVAVRQGARTLFVDLKAQTQ